VEGGLKVFPDLASIKVYRFDPATDSSHKYDAFENIPYKDHSVLEVLQFIYENRDPSLSFRRLCTKGFCGGCAVVVNGQPVLACQYPAEKEMILDPHPKFEVIRDLSVDFNRLRPGYSSDSRAGRKGLTMIHLDLKKCVHCRDCIFICPVGVWQWNKEAKRVEIADPASCLGPSCRQCSDSCWKEAIQVTR
jgi:fumarate reductase (CoM/CoB) subunit B